MEADRAHQHKEVHSVEEVLTELHAEGKTESHGAITIDIEHGSKLLGKYRISTPSRFGVTLFACSVLGGAKKFNLFISPRWAYKLLYSWWTPPLIPFQIVVTFDGNPFTKTQLQDLDKYAFAEEGEPESQRLAYLARSLLALQKLKPTRLRFVSWIAPDEGISLDCKHSPFKLTSSRRQKPGEPANRLEVKLPRTLPSSFLTGNPSGVPWEQIYGLAKKHLLTRYCSATTRLYTDNIFGQDIPITPTIKIPPDILTAAYYEQPELPLPIHLPIQTYSHNRPWSLLLWVPKEFPITSKLFFVEHGIIWHEKHLSWDGLGVIGYVHINGLKKDLSGNSPVEDSTYSSLLNELQQTANTMVSNWLEAKPDTDDKKHLRSLLNHRRQLKLSLRQKKEHPCTINLPLTDLILTGDYLLAFSQQQAALWELNSFQHLSSWDNPFPLDLDDRNPSQVFIHPHYPLIGYLKPHDHRITLINPISSQRFDLTHPTEVIGAVFAPNSSVLYTLTRDNLLHGWDTDTGTQNFTSSLPLDHEAPPLHITIDPSRGNILTTHSTGYAFLWDPDPALDKPKNKWDLFIGTHLTSPPAFSPSGTYFALIHYDVLKIYDSSTPLYPVKQLELYHCQAARWLDDSFLWITTVKTTRSTHERNSHQEYFLNLLNLSTTRCIRRLQTLDGDWLASNPSYYTLPRPCKSSVNRQGWCALASSNHRVELRYFFDATKSRDYILYKGSIPRALALHPDRKILAVLFNTLKKISIWDLEKGALLKNIPLS